MHVLFFNQVFARAGSSNEIESRKWCPNANLCVPNPKPNQCNGRRFVPLARKCKQRRVHKSPQSGFDERDVHPSFAHHVPRDSRGIGRNHSVLRSRVAPSRAAELCFFALLLKMCENILMNLTGLARHQTFPSVAELESGPYEIHCQFMPFEFLGDAGVVHCNGRFLQKVHSVCAADAHFVAPTATVERLWQFSLNHIEQLSRFLMHVPLPKAVPLVPYAALGCAQYREQLRNAPGAKRMPCPFPNCDRFFMHASMRSHIAGHFLRGHRWAGQEGADKGAFCLWCGNTDGKCGTSVHGKKIDSNCSLAYHWLRLNNAATPTAMNPSTNLPVRCKVLDCRKWHCTYAMPHHMAQAHLGVSHDYAGCSEEEKRKVLQAFDNFRAPLPPKAKPAAPPALPTVLPALLSGPNQGSSSSGSSSSSSSTTNASSSTSASSSSSAPLGTSDYVSSESMSDGPATCHPKP